MLSEQYALIKMLYSPRDAFIANNMQHITDNNELLKPLFLPSSLRFVGQADFGKIDIIDQYQNGKSIPRVIIKPGIRLDANDPRKANSKFDISCYKS